MDASQSRRLPTITRRRLLGATLAATGWTLLQPLGREVVHAQAPPTRVLSNGLTVVVEQRPSADTVAMVIGARVGSREDTDRPGTNAFTARTMFQGTARWPSATALQRAAALAGGTIDQSASAEMSAFASVMPSQRAELGFQLLGSVVSEPLFEPAAIQRQKLLAAQELDQRTGSPGAILADLFGSRMFDGHPLGMPGLGTPESLAALGPGNLTDHYSRYWVGANLTLAVAGRIAASEAMDMAQRYFGDIPAGLPNRRASQRAGGPRTVTTVRHRMEGEQVGFRLGFLGPSRLEPDVYPLLVLSTMMNGFSGRLLPALRSERGLVYDAAASYLGYTDTGCWFVAGSVDPANLAEALAVVWDEIDRARRLEASPEEVARRVSQMAGEQVLADETNIAHAGRSVRQAILGIESAADLLRRIRGVTGSDVRRVAEAYLDPGRSLLVLVGPTPE